mmetsp:Transcript_37406/g.58938  ORF Transcript_37406/g.58938 Transcript_37406/m.58938 type:complete len:192 (-) Transcript_37406:1248-1823(-)
MANSKGEPRSVSLDENRSDHQAPDGSEIRNLTATKGGGLSHCRVPPGGVTAPVYHKTTEELWYCLKGKGQVWRGAVVGGDEGNGSGWSGGGEGGKIYSGSVEEVEAGVSLNIPVLTPFQIKNTGEESLDLILATIPPSPGAEEAVAVSEGRWETSKKRKPRDGEDNNEVDEGREKKKRLIDSEEPPEYWCT